MKLERVIAIFQSRFHIFIDSRCIAITYPDLDGFPVAKGKDGYHVIDGQREDIDIDSDSDLTDVLDSPGLALLTRLQVYSFFVCNLNQI